MGNLLKRLRGENPENLNEDSGFTPYSWPTDSKATLCRVPWDAEYRNVVDWQDQQHKDSYFSSLESDSCELGSMTYLKPNDPIFVDVPFSKAYSYNYIVVENPKLPVPGEVEPRKLYYFVTAVGYVAPNTTSIAVQLDVWTTYGDTAEFGRCFVERGHVGIAAEMSKPTPTADKLGPARSKVYRRYLTAAEGLDIGNEYLIGDVDAFSIADYDHGWAVVIMSTTDLLADWGTLSNPSMTTADGQVTDGLIGGCNVYSLSTADFRQFMKNIRNYPWVAKGIISVTAFPKALLTDGPSVDKDGVTLYFLGTTPDKGFYREIDDVWERLSKSIPDRYRNLHKLLCYPYSVIELNTYNGSPVLLKPELLNTDTLRLRNISCAVPGHIKIGFYPWAYDSERLVLNEYGLPVVSATMDDPTVNLPVSGNSLDSCVWMQEMPKFSLVNDNYLNYLASTTHTREWQYNSAGWQQAKSNASAHLSYDQAQQQIATNRANWNASTRGLLGNVAGNIGNLAMSGADALGIGGAVSGAADFANGVLGTVSGAIGATGWDNMQGIVNNLTGLTELNNNQALQGNIASQNLDLAQWAAQGDYENAIAKINATVQDAALTAPSVIGQAGGSGFSMSNGLFVVQTRFKTIDQNHMHIIGEYWLRYGYAVREFMVPPADLCCMEHFTYWKMLETSVECALADETSKETIRGIFEKGVTVWRSADEITTWDLSDNDPILGDYY
jgi:hypothetical protein